MKTRQATGWLEDQMRQAEEDYQNWPQWMKTALDNERKARGIKEPEK